ncbi:MAG: hypothetical protein Q4D81_14915 [Eubacteriales bacterium]|nr:hypothetical protein [Eubacteriales bacterium]
MKKKKTNHRLTAWMLFVCLLLAVSVMTISVPASPGLTDSDRNFRDGSSSSGKDRKSRKAIKSSDVSLSKSVFTYDGRSKKPGVTVRVGGKTLRKNKDFSVSYHHNKKPGKGSVIVRGKGSYKGCVTKHFRIRKG